MNPSDFDVCLSIEEVIGKVQKPSSEGALKRKVSSENSDVSKKKVKKVNLRQNLIFLKNFIWI